VLAFPDYLEDVPLIKHLTTSCVPCTKVRLDRQVGSRYFVTASKAAKILFLQVGKSVGNKLEQDVFRKLQDADELSQLKADALMFHHVYPIL